EHASHGTAPFQGRRWITAPVYCARQTAGARPSEEAGDRDRDVVVLLGARAEIAHARKDRLDERGRAEAAGGAEAREQTLLAELVEVAAERAAGHGIADRLVERAGARRAREQRPLHLRRGSQLLVETRFREAFDHAGAVVQTLIVDDFAVGHREQEHESITDR